MKVAVPAVRSRGELYLSPHFGRAQFFVIAEIHGSEVKVLSVEKSPGARLEHGRGKIIIGFLKKLGVQAVIVKNIGPNAFHRLRSAGVKAYTPLAEETGLLKVSDVLKVFAEGKVKELLKSTEE